MNNKQQTAIQKFWDKIALKLSVEQLEEFIPLLKESKEMEKEQTIKTSLFWSHSTVRRKDIEDYYNETYGGGIK